MSQDQTNTKSNQLPPSQRPSLTRAVWDEVAVAVGRMEDIQNKPEGLRTAEELTEMEGLVEFAAKTFLDYAPDFLGCWLTVHQEYVPFLKAFTPVMLRCQAIHTSEVKARMASQAQHAAQSNPDGTRREANVIVPGNVSDLTKAGVSKHKVAGAGQMLGLTPQAQEQLRTAIAARGV